MGAPGEDILLSPRARRDIPYSLECKHRASSAVYKYLEQRDNYNNPNMGEERNYPSVVFLKANHKEPIVIMYAEDFLKLIKRT